MKVFSLLRIVVALNESFLLLFCKKLSITFEIEFSKLNVGELISFSAFDSALNEFR
jgi:hypothetical protein